jgi:hypothetical protein
LVGAPFSFRPRWTATSLANFPGGPFPHTGTQFLITEPNENQTLDPVDTSFAQATTVVAGSTGLEGVITQQEFSDGSDAAFIAPDFDPAATVGFAHPTISDPTTRVVVLERRRHGSCQSSTNCTVRAVLAFIGLGTSGNPQNLPAIVNATGADEAFPAFTPDGRYLGFVRQTSTADDRLFVFDTVTQTLLNDQGVDLGFVGAPFSSRDELRRMEGNLSLRETPVFAPLFQVSLNTNLVTFQTVTFTGVGLLVQRIVGRQRLFGHVVRKLKTVGRVPLGKFSRGKHSVHWNLRVDGRRLRRGTYLVTPRSLTSRNIVTGLGTPRVLKIR